MPKTGSTNASSQRGLSPLAVGYLWASRVGNMGLQMALPALAGYWIDLQWLTRPVFTISGAVLGFALFMLKLLALAKELSKSSSQAGLGTSSSSKSDSQQKAGPRNSI